MFYPAVLAVEAGAEAGVKAVFAVVETAELDLQMVSVAAASVKVFAAVREAATAVELAVFGCAQGAGPTELLTDPSVDAFPPLCPLHH